MKVIFLVLLLSSFSSLTLTEVVDSFQNSCPSFFIRKPKKPHDIIVPMDFSGHQYKTICQLWKNKYRFATLYDTEKRIPVYSAYTFLKEVTTKRNPDWKIEPQLENIKEYEGKKEMIDSPTTKENNQIKNKIINQAVNSDYSGSYSRGHVFPNSIAGDQDQADSTFTLTNVAPQIQDRNERWAREVEEPMLRVINQTCSLDQNHPAYIVTGVVPGNKWISITRETEYKKGINVPSHFWSAFCCRNKTNTNTLVKKAYLADMENFNVRNPSIDNLNKRLEDLYKKKEITFRVFPHC